jgi:hypothetical protein
MTPPIDPNSGRTWTPGTGDSEDSLRERITAKLIVRGLILGSYYSPDDSCRTAIDMMASWKAMLVLLRHNGELTEYDRRVIVRINDRVMAELVVAGLWVYPWTEVAENEFTGIKFDQAKVDEFIADVPEEVERHSRIGQISTFHPADMLSFLEEHGYDIQQPDVELITSLCIYRLAAQFMPAVMGEHERELDLADVFRPIFSRAQPTAPRGLGGVRRPLLPKRA